METFTKLQSSIPYVLAFGLGLLLGKISPEWMVLPAFFCSLGCIVALAIAAHTVPPLERWRGVSRFVLVISALVLGPNITEIKTGPAPRAFILALLFTFGLVFFLAVFKSAA
jgi:hypothetical protein